MSPKCVLFIDMLHVSSMLTMKVNVSSSYK